VIKCVGSVRHLRPAVGSDAGSDAAGIIWLRAAPIAVGRRGSVCGGVTLAAESSTVCVRRQYIVVGGVVECRRRCGGVGSRSEAWRCGCADSGSWKRW
jgi:hypothetical protein